MGEPDFWADVVAVIHVGYVQFVLLGFVLIVAGDFLRWQWTSNRWFRAAHLLSITYTAIQTWLGMSCPLTRLETWLRSRATVEPLGFVARWSHPLFFRGAGHQKFSIAVSSFLVIVLVYLAAASHRFRGSRLEPAGV